VHAHRLLREPAEELGAVGHLPARLGEGLAHLERHHEGELVGARGDRLERSAQDLAAVAGRRRGPRRLGGDGGVEGGDAVGDGRVGH
jgi:hypothetical protein